jgi:predicted nuclease of predicted toxin-antitoxin system
MEMPAGTADRDLLAAADAEGRVLLTHDLDFGELVFKFRLSSPSLVLMRFTTRSADDRLALLKGWWLTIESLASQNLFIVVSDDSIRSRPMS